MVLLLSIACLVLAGVAFLYLAPTFGAKPSGQSLARIAQSDRFQGGVFVNSVPTEVSTRRKGEPSGLRAMLQPPTGKNPTAPLPSVAFDQARFSSGDFVWFGHSTLLFRTADTTVLIDPVYHRASPIPVGGKPFDMQVSPTIDALPPVDVVLISHDHYDHLDHRAIASLADRVALFLVPLGIRDHLLRWDVPESNIVELDWHQTRTVGGTEFTLTPSRHFSGRGLRNRNSTLWGSWVIRDAQSAIFFGGDSGYFPGFAQIGERYGPFDIAFIENGAYDPQWAQIHMQPEESVQAAIDLDAALYFPIHWGKFDLARHGWTDPIERAVLLAEERKLPIAAARIGQTFRPEQRPFDAWWTLD